VRARARELAKLWYANSAGDAERAARLTAPSVDVLARGGCFCLASLMQGLDAEPFAPGPFAAPILRVWGERDRSHRRSQPDGLPGTLVRFATAGHSPELEEPAAFVDAILRA
jgi:pimeloyl-ACP methyl ester carboxylesterase